MKTAVTLVRGFPDGSPSANASALRDAPAGLLGTSGFAQCPFAPRRRPAPFRRPGRAPRPTARRRASVATLLLVGCAVACGRKTIVKAPELVAPERIENLSASNATDGVRLTWRRPERYADGSRMDDLGMFRIERGSGDGAFAVVATLEVTDRDRFRQERRFDWVDANAALGGMYYYRVVSLTTDGYVSEPSNVAAIARAAPSPTAPPPRAPTPR